MNTKAFLKKLFGGTLCLLALIVAIQSVRITRADKGSTPIEAYADTAKKERWYAMEKKVDSWTDGCGKLLDTGIKKMVIVLNLLGIKTEQSCEGHLNWGRAYPWVSFDTETSELKELKTTYKNLWKAVEEKKEEIAKKYPDLSEREALRKARKELKKEDKELENLWKEKLEVSVAMDKLRKFMILPLQKLIIQFYQQHPVDLEVQLNIDYKMSFELFSLDGEWQIIRNDAEKLQKLKAYQQEMDAFADFLVAHYFNS